MKKKLLAILLVVLLILSTSIAALATGAPPASSSAATEPPASNSVGYTSSSAGNEESSSVPSSGATESDDSSLASQPVEPFVYSARPQSAEEVQAAWDAYVNDGATLPRWEEAIDEAWVPEGAMQGEYTDAESGSVYYSLAPAAVEFEYDPAPQNRFEVWVAGLNYKVDPVLYPLPKWESSIENEWVPVGFIQELVIDEETETEYYTLAPARMARLAFNGNTAEIATAQDVIDAMAAINGSLDPSYTEVILALQAGFTGGTHAINNTSARTVVVDGSAAGTVAASFGLTAGSGKVVMRNLTLEGKATTAAGNYEFATNTFTNSNGGISLGGNAVVTISDCIFTNLTGSGISGGGSSNITITNCLFEKNTAMAGGAIYCESNSTITISNSTFLQNTANNSGYNGGAIAIDSKSNVKLDISNSYFKENSMLYSNTGGTGGAIGFYCSTGSMSVDQCVFEGNSTPGGTNTGDGGAIAIKQNRDVTVGMTYSITNTTFSGNTASDDGAAILIEGYAGRKNTNVLIIGTIENCTFYKNIAQGNGGGNPGGAIQFFARTTTTLSNNTFYANQKINGMGGAYAASTSAVFLSPVPTIYRFNNLFVANTSGSGTGDAQQISGGTNRGGNTLVPAAGTEAIFGTSDPKLASNGSGTTAGCSVGGQSVVSVTTLYIAPNLGLSGETYADSSGLASGNSGNSPPAPVSDQRNYVRGPVKDSGAVEIVSARFDANGGAWSATTAYSYASPIRYSSDSKVAGVAANSGTTLNVPAEDKLENGALVLLGWSTNSAATAPDSGLEYSTGTPTSVPINYNTDDVTYYAIWGTKTTYKVVYHKNDGVTPEATVNDPTTYSAGSAVTLPTAADVADASGDFNWSRANYRFMGWATSAGSTTVISSFSMPNPLTEDQHLFAVWVREYTVTFNSQGGSAVNPITGVLGGNKINAPTAPTRSGYTFGGWFKEAGCTNGWNFGSDTVNSDITLYAKWTQNYVPPTSTPDSSSSAPSSSSGAPASSIPANSTSTPPAPPPESSSQVPSSTETVVVSEASSSSQAAGINIGGTHIPLVGRGGNHWALVNLIAAVVSLLGGAGALVVGARRKKNNEEDDTPQNEQHEEESRKTGNRLWQILSGASGVASPVLFFLTENMRLPMALVDKWTPVMVAILLAQGIFAALQWNTKRKNSEEPKEA